MRAAQTFCIVLLAAACLAAPGGAVPAETDALLVTDAEAVVLAPPQLAAPPHTTLLQFSPDGRYLLAVSRQTSITPE